MTTTTDALSIGARLLLGLCLVAAAATLVMRRPPFPAGGDQPRYATVALNLADHGVFSAERYHPARRPTPSLAWAGPVIALELAALARLDPATHAALACLAGSAPPPCETRFAGLRLVHLAEILLFLAAVLMIARTILESERLAWVAAGLALAFRETVEFANAVLTEPLYLMVYGLIAAALTRALARERAPRAWAVAGLAVGVGILVKSSLLLAAPLIPAGLVARALWRRDGAGRAIASAAVFSLAALAVVGLWIGRNWLTLGTPAITDPVYLEASLSHRLAYNRMSWAQWLAGWIYYLPDFGDNLGGALFGRDRLAGLGWGKQSFYEYGFHVLHAEARARAAPAIATRYLIETHVLAEPLKFIAVTLLLTWRGLFVGRYLGLAGLVTLPFAMRALAPRPRRLLGVLAGLALALALLHGAVSVSIPRYNLALIPPFAIALAWAVGQAGLMVARRRRR